jgi:carboxylesterase type B
VEARANGSITEKRARPAVGEFSSDGDVEAYYDLLSASGVETDPVTDPVTVFETVNSDWEFRMPSAQLAFLRPAVGARTHLYELAYTVPKMNGAFGSPHGSDNPLVFGNFRGSVTDRFYVYPPAAET